MLWRWEGINLGDLNSISLRTWKPISNLPRMRAHPILNVKVKTFFGKAYKKKRVFYRSFWIRALNICNRCFRHSQNQLEPLKCALTRSNLFWISRTLSNSTFVLLFPFIFSHHVSLLPSKHIFKWFLVS